MSIVATLLNTLGLRRAEVAGERITAMEPLADREFLVPNMVCEGCAEKVAGSLTSLPGVRNVTSKVPQKRVRIRYEPGKVRDQQLKDALTRIGFTPLETEERT